jgi:hypothetical protein
VAFNCNKHVELVPVRVKDLLLTKLYLNVFFSSLFQHVLKVDVLKLNPADSPRTSKKPAVDVLEKSKVFIKEANSPTVKKPDIDDDTDSPRVHKKSKGDAINTASVLKKPSVEHTESLKENLLVNESDIKPVNQLQRPGLKRKAIDDEDSETTPLAKRPHLHDSATEKPIFRPARTTSITADHEQQEKMAV